MNANDIAQKGTPAAAIAAMLVLWLEFSIEHHWLVEVPGELVLTTIAGLTPIIGFLIHKVTQAKDENNGQA